MKATLILSNGAVFQGKSIGAIGECVCEMVFNTSMVGYQEILTDPSYAGQGVVMSYPLVGNYGVNSEDDQSAGSWCSAFVVRHLSERGSNFRNEGTLDQYLKQNNIVGIEGVDTRAITRILRNQGTMNGMITCAEHFCVEEKLAEIRAYQIRGAVEKVTRKEPEQIPAQSEEKLRMAVMDYGVTKAMIEGMTSRGCSVTVYPANTPAETILNGGYAGVMLSNGPGDPTENTAAIAEIKKLYDGTIPLFAIGLGHQMLALANGIRVNKMPFGHRGGNHPVRAVKGGRLFITNQNHGYCVCGESVDAAVAEISHVHVNDGSVEGLNYARPNCISIQFSPEGSPGPEDIFDRFVEMMVKGDNCNA